MRSPRIIRLQEPAASGVLISYQPEAPARQKRLNSSLALRVLCTRWKSSKSLSQKRLNSSLALRVGMIMSPKNH